MIAMMNQVTTKSALFIDDNFYNRDLASLALRHVGYQVSEAVDGVQALKILETERFDLIVLDLAMPEVDGNGVLHQLHDTGITGYTYVIVMTANPHMATGEVEMIADYVMYKPIDVAEFARFAQRMSVTKKGRNSPI